MTASPPPATPAVPRPAATVMVVRPAPGGYQVFMVRRHQASKFAADVYVFPGGTIRQDDRLPPETAGPLGFDAAALNTVLTTHQDPFAEKVDGGVAIWSAALRELFEEAGVLLAEQADGQLVDLSDPARAAHFEALRAELQEDRLSLADLARRESLRFAPERLVYFSRWITPPHSPRRFDTRFFVAGVPAGQLAAHCQVETTDGLWISPREVLARHDAEQFPMMFVTREHVKRLAEFDEPEALLGYAREKPFRLVQASVDPEGRTFLPAEQQGTW